MTRPLISQTVAHHAVFAQMCVRRIIYVLVMVIRYGKAKRVSGVWRVCIFVHPVVSNTEK